MRQSYFGPLNYSLANEDTALELGILPENPGHVFSIAGSGARVLPLLARGPAKVSVADVSMEQLHLTELRMRTVRALTHSEFLLFWGYPTIGGGRLLPDDRKKLYRKLGVSGAVDSFAVELFERNGWENVLYTGKWEGTFQKLSKLNRAFTRDAGARLFDARDLGEQRSYVTRGFPRHAFDAVLFLAGNHVVFNALLYHGSFPKKNIPGSFFGFYKRAFGHLFEHTLARQNFFLQLVFFGELRFPEGNPIECQPDVFARIKAGLEKAEIEYFQGDVLQAAAKAAKRAPIDFVSISDVPSYFSGEAERGFMRDLKAHLAPGGQVVIRSYLHVPEGTDLSGYEEATAEYRDLIRQEKFQVYQVDVYRKKADTKEASK